MLSDNFEYLTDEERGWREEIVNRSSTRFLFGLFQPRAEWRLLSTLDRLAQARSRVISLGDVPQQQPAYIAQLEQQLAKLLFALDRAESRANQPENPMPDTNPELERQRAQIAKLEEQLAHYKTRLANEKSVTEKLAAEEKRGFAMSAELEVLRRRVAELQREQKPATVLVERQPITQQPPTPRQDKPVAKPEPQPEHEPEQPADFSNVGIHVTPRGAGTHF